MDYNEIIDLIKEYYIERNLQWPTFSDALKFVHTEIAEVYELDLDRIGGWTRNHPENKPKFSKESLSEELGDAILMLLVAGIVEGVNPLESMINKMNLKLEKISGKSELRLISPSEYYEESK